MFTAVRLQICCIAICHFNFLGRAMKHLPTGRSCSGPPACHFWYSMSYHAQAIFISACFAIYRSLFRKLVCWPCRRSSWICPSSSCPATSGTAWELHLRCPWHQDCSLSLAVSAESRPWAAIPQWAPFRDPSSASCACSFFPRFEHSWRYPSFSILGYFAS